jgi:DNA-binding CsgD family transcriptional regulator
LDAVAADPLAPMHVGIVAPGGFGKTTVLHELGEAYRRAGADVRTIAQALTPDLASFDGRAAVLLVDDAHQLSESQLQSLRRLAETEELRLAVAYRPWPRSAALTELTDVLARTGLPLMPSPFDKDQIRDFLTASYGTEPRPSLVEFVYVQTGGIPRFVSRVVRALGEVGDSQVYREGLREAKFEVPPSAIAQFRRDLDRLDADIQRFLLAVEAGAGLHIELLSSLLRRDADAIDEVMDAARATGLLGRDGTLLPISRSAVRSLIPADRRVAVRQRLAELELERGGSVLALARSLLGTGTGGAGVAAVFEAAADEALPEQPELSAELFAAATSAGRPASSLAARWARAAALSGDLHSALRLADQVIADEGSVDRADGARIGAMALAHHGQLGRSAELYRWSGGGSAIAFAVVGLIGTGQLATAAQLLAAPPADGPPTLLAGAASLMAHGVHASVTGSANTALSTLVHASALLEPAGRTELLPDSPAATAALVALHCGELQTAESVLARAVGSGMGGVLMAARHRLLQAWVCMLRGQLSSARESLTIAEKTTKTLAPRDWLFAIALEMGLARRNSDLPEMRRIWGHACEAIMRAPVDLFTFLPLGEFAMAAARLGDQGRLTSHLQEARSLLGELGDPPLWWTTLHWSGLHAALVGEQPEVAQEHAAALAAYREHGQYFAVMSAAAACWLDVLAGKIDPDSVEAAARGLHGAGLWWDGARLAGQAAIRTSDRKAMVRLLDCARLLQGRAVDPRNSATSADAPSGGHAKATAAAVGEGKLSQREQEVASLVLSGLTYKQVGDRLFISAKTVEHHIARMRQRLGCASRSELLAQLRQLVSED